MGCVAVVGYRSRRRGFGRGSRAIRATGAAAREERFQEALCKALLAIAPISEFHTLADGPICAAALASGAQQRRDPYAAVRRSISWTSSRR